MAEREKINLEVTEAREEMTGEIPAEIEQVLPAEIEKRSFEIITEELGEIKLIQGTEPIVKRCIHTSADFDYAKNLVFSEHAVETARRS